MNRSHFLNTFLLGIWGPIALGLLAGFGAYRLGDSWHGDSCLIAATACLLRILYLLRTPVAGIAQHVFIYWGLIFLATLMLGWVGVDYGLQLLIFHDYPVAQFLNGISTALLTGLVFFLIFTLDKDERDKCKEQIEAIHNTKVRLSTIRIIFAPTKDDLHSRIPFYVFEWSFVVCLFLGAIASLVRLFNDEITSEFAFCMGLAFGVVLNFCIAKLSDHIGFERIVGCVHAPFDKRSSTTKEQIANKNKGMRRLARLPVAFFGLCYFIIVLFFWIANQEGTLENLPIFVSLNLILMLFASISGWLESQRHGATLLWIIGMGIAMIVLNGIRIESNNQHKFQFDGFKNEYTEEKYIPLDTWLYQNVALRYAGMDGNPQVLLRSRDVSDKNLQGLKENWLGADKVDINSKWAEQANQASIATGRNNLPEHPVLVVITVSGGGIRAAYWTSLVLRELELRFADNDVYFPAHVRLVTGASGGMLAAARYVATVPKPDADFFKGNWKESRMKTLNRIVSACGQGSLTPVANTLLFKDIPGMFVPVVQHWDRGKELESEWMENWEIDTANGETSSPLNKTFSQLRLEEMAGWRPSIAYTPMLAEDGRRLIISNLDLSIATRGVAAELLPDKSSVVRNSGNDLKDPSFWRNGYKENVDVLSCSALEFFRLFPDSELTLSTATRMSASFPLISPAVSLPTIPPRHVVDAGYYDNYGVNLAAQWIAANRKQLISVAKKAKKPDEAKFSAVLLIRIRDNQSAALRKEIDQDMDWEQASIEGIERNKLDRKGQLLTASGGTEFSEYVKTVREFKGRKNAAGNVYLGRVSEAATRWFSTPWQGMGRARQAAMMYRNDEQVESINESLPKDEERHRVMTVVFDCPTTASLSWYLSQSEKNEMEKAVGDGENAKKFENTLTALWDWWEDVEGTRK